MPRLPRIDQAGLLQHVMARGIDKCSLFLDDRDRSFFLGKLLRLLSQSQTSLLAWALMPNHLHLLLRVGDEPMHYLMRRLLTSYAIWFNQRHRRHGHLFQNRYKSLVCQEEPYLLALIRYLHLNPLRSGLVSTVELLDHYPWCGHGVLMGNVVMPEQAVEEVLALFGSDPPLARRNYRDFIARGIRVGCRTGPMMGSISESEEMFATVSGSLKVLGDQRFLASVVEKTSDRKFPSRSIPLSGVLVRVASAYEVKPEELLCRARLTPLSEARAVFCHIAMRQFGYSASEVGRFLGMTGTASASSCRRGGKVLEKRPGLAIRMDLPEGVGHGDRRLQVESTIS